MVALSILGVIFILSLAGLIYYAMFIAPEQQRASLTNGVQAQAQETVMEAIAMATAQAVAAQQQAATEEISTEEQVDETLVPEVSNETSEEAKDKSVGGAEVNLSRTQTVAALLTQVGGTQPAAEATAVPATALPDTGFADDIGLPGLVGLAFLLLIIVFSIRRLRTSMG